MLISTMMTGWHALAIIGVSLAIMHAFVYAVEFRGQTSVHPELSVWSEFLRLTVVAYALALLVCLYVLWSFGRSDGLALGELLMQTVVLGFPAAIGAQRRASSYDAPRRASGRPGRAIKAPGRADDRELKYAIPLLEWIVAGLGVLLVGGAIAFLVYHSMTRPDAAGPPRGRGAGARAGPRLRGAVPRPQRGGSTAAEVTIEGELVGPDGATERAEAVLDYLPPRSDREGALLFTTDPRRGELRLRATGYAKP